MKVMAPSSGGFRSFALPKEDPPVNLTTLAKELPSTHRLYQTVVSVRGFDSEFGFTQELSDQKFEEIMALANSAFRVTCKNPDEEQIVQYIHLHASSKVRQVLSDLVSKVKQVIEYQKYIQQEYIHVGSELQQTLDRVDRLYALTKKYSHLISRTIGGWDVLEIKFRIDTYSKKLPPSLIIRFFESAGDFLCCTSSRKKSYRHCSSYSSHSSTSFSSRKVQLIDQFLLTRTLPSHVNSSSNLSGISLWALEQRLILSQEVETCSMVARNYFLTTIKLYERSLSARPQYVEHASNLPGSNPT